jgi:hypothetical protein
MDRCAMINPLNHPVYQELPQRTQRKMLSPISEDKLTWDCFFGLKQAESLGPALSAALNLPPDTFKEAELILWGFQIGESSNSNATTTESRRVRRPSLTQSS